MNKNYVFAALAVGASACLFLWGFDFIAVLFLTVVLTFCFSAFGPKAFGLYCALSLAAIFCSSKFNIVYTAAYTAFAVLVSLSLGYGFNKNKTLSSIMTSSCTIAVTVVALLVVYLMKEGNKSAFHVVTGFKMNEIRDIFEQAGANSFKAQDIDLIIKALDLMLPSVLIITVCMSVYIVFGIARSFLEKNGLSFPNLRRFPEIRLSRGFTMVFLLIVLTSLFFETNGIALNLVSVVSMLFILGGLSYIDFCLEKKNIKKQIRVIIYIFTYIVSVLTGIGAAILLPGLLILGTVDSVKDLRNRYA
ncbi:MAG: DUF2232 domain-containing protein [Clostridia bacterium]|nr:DUF2232 domain-containing protein [Clostridia bacterium]